MTDLSYQRILVIYNPTAGQTTLDKLDEIINELKKRDVKVDVAETHYAGHASEIASNVIDDHYDLIVAAGGDGTINEVINGLYPRNIALAVIPFGTANVLASELGLKTSVLSIVDYLTTGVIYPTWLGLANGKYFSLMLSVGADAKSVASVSTRLKKTIGKYAYIFSYLKTIIGRSDAMYEVTIDGKNYKASNVIVSNGRYYGGKYICAPDADIRNREFCVTLALKSGRIAALKYAILMFTQKYPYSKSVVSIVTTRVSIASKFDDEPIQIDGDHSGNLPVDISISQEPIKLLFPV